jgi:hypothetical protein
MRGQKGYVCAGVRGVLGRACAGGHPPGRRAGWRTGPPLRCTPPDPGQQPGPPPAPPCPRCPRCRRTERPTPLGRLVPQPLATPRSVPSAATQCQGHQLIPSHHHHHHHPHQPASPPPPTTHPHHTKGWQGVKASPRRTCMNHLLKVRAPTHPRTHSRDTGRGEGTLRTMEGVSDPPLTSAIMSLKPRGRAKGAWQAPQHHSPREPRGNRM